MQDLLKGKWEPRRPKNPVAVAAFDSEDDSNGNLISIAFTDGRNHKVFKDRRRALKWLGGHDFGRVQFWAHNLEYDLINMFRGTLGSVHFKYYGSRLISGRLYGTRTAFGDSLNLAPMSLKKAGEIIGLKKLKFNPQSKEYVVRDALIVHKLVDGLADYLENMGGALKNTIGSSALHLWACSYADLPLAVVSVAARGFFRAGYYGGRVEVFRYGKRRGALSYVDVNSLYPSVMRGFYPDLWGIRMGGAHGVARARISVPAGMAFPPLPFRDENGKTVFPTGRWTGFYCTNELEYARSLGVKVRILDRIGSDGMVAPFKTYVEELYAKRKAAKSDAEKTFLKLLMNSLYGKFGTAGGYAQEIRPLRTIEGDYHATDGTAGLVKKLVKPPGYANILWSAWTTAQARIILHRGILEIVKSGGAPLYCDTDSLIFSGKNPFNISEELGAWKLEEILNEFQAKGPKFYRFHARGAPKPVYKAKGVRRDAAGEMFVRGIASFRKPIRLRESLKMREPVFVDGVPLTGTDAANVWIKVTKRNLHPTPKRNIKKGGLTTPPHIG